MAHLPHFVATTRNINCVVHVSFWMLVWVGGFEYLVHQSSCPEKV